MAAERRPPGAGRTPRAGSRPGASARSGVRPPSAPGSRTTTTPGLSVRTRRTTRIAILGFIALALVISVAPTLRVYLRQRDQIDALRAQAAATTAQVANLQQQQARWSDPAYVEAQARSRLQFVKPGQRSYVVIEPPAKAPVAPASGVVAGAVGGAGSSWIDGLWQSVQKAGAAPAGPAK